MKALSDAKLNYLIQKIKSWINETFCTKTDANSTYSAKAHKHGLETDVTGTLAPEHGGTGVQSIEELKAILGSGSNTSPGGTLTVTGTYLGTDDEVLHIVLADNFYPELVVIVHEGTVTGDLLTLPLPEKEGQTYKSIGGDEDTFIEYGWDRSDTYYDWENKENVTGRFNRVVISTSRDKVKYINNGNSEYRYFIIGRNTESSPNFSYVP